MSTFSQTSTQESGRIITPSELIRTTYITMHKDANPVIKLFPNEKDDTLVDDGALPPQPTASKPTAPMTELNIFKTTTTTTTTIKQEEEDQPQPLYFGILEIQVNDTPMVTQPNEILISSDMSGSMDDLCKDGRTKMQHSAHTAKNIISVLGKNADKSTNYFKLSGFDDKVEEIVPRQKVTEEEVAKMRDTISKKMYSRGGTNIEAALTSSQLEIAERQQIEPMHRQIHIMMTDGEATVGRSDTPTLQQLVSSTYTNIFVGYGESHNASLLQTLAKTSNGEYYFIGKIEEAGLVFGEIVHGILYRALYNITITMIDSEIYDYSTNTWVTSLTVSSINSEAKKTYHVRTYNPYNINAVITATSALHTDMESQAPVQIEEEVNVLPTLLESDSETGKVTMMYPDLSKYMLRQRTQELLFKAHNESLQTSSDQDKYQMRQLVPPPRLNACLPRPGHQEDHILDETQLSPRQVVKRELQQFLTFLTQYIMENGLLDDDFHKTLCEDIRVVLQTYDTPTAAMYSASRQHTQGRELSYTCSAPEDDTNSYAPLRRQNAVNGLAEDDEDEDGPSSRRLVPQMSRTNTTVRQATIMREVSSDGRDMDEYENDGDDNNLDSIFHRPTLLRRNNTSPSASAAGVGIERV